MESMQFDKYVALDILNRVHISIEHIEERSQPYLCGDDFLMSSTGVAWIELSSTTTYASMMATDTRNTSLAGTSFLQRCKTNIFFAAYLR